MNKQPVYQATLMAVFLLIVGRLEAQTPWIHVEVTEEGAKRSKVHINLPLSVVQVAVDVAPQQFLSEAHIKLDHHRHHDLSVQDLRRIWRELRDSGEAEFVSVEEENETVIITREEDLIRIDVTDHSPERSDGETVHVKIPVRVVDALLSGEGEELNLREALEELRNERGDIVRVEGPDENVRIWIDERNGK